MSVVDPGFPVVGGADPLEGVLTSNTYIFQQKRVKMKELDPVGEGRMPAAPLAPPVYVIVILADGFLAYIPCMSDDIDLIKVNTLDGFQKIPECRNIYMYFCTIARLILSTSLLTPVADVGCARTPVSVVLRSIRMGTLHARVCVVVTISYIRTIPVVCKICRTYRNVKK